MKLKVADWLLIAAVGLSVASAQVYGWPAWVVGIWVVIMLFLLRGAWYHSGRLSMWEKVDEFEKIYDSMATALEESSMMAEEQYLEAKDAYEKELALIRSHTDKIRRKKAQEPN